MTQLGEPVAIGMVDSDETKCPFDHDTPTPPKVDNYLIGVGTKLASKMKSGSSTHLYDKYRSDQDPIPNPNKVKGHPFFYKSGSRKPRPVVLNIRKDAKSKQYIHKYPVTCAAHHCIPAQESLKGSPLLEFMVKKGDPEPVKDGSFTKGVVWSDVGYDVNGIENGVWLPGNYAVGGGRGGMGVWEGDDNEDDDDEDGDDDGGALEDEDAEVVSLGLADPIIDSAPSSNALNGAQFQADPNNRKWRYAAQAMKLAPGQFHDRHEAYSDFVKKYLIKIHANYLSLKEKNFDGQKCPDCKKRADKIKDLGVPTPYGLVARLNALSAKFRGLLRGPGWAPQVYTSKWVKSFMDKRDGGL